MKLSLGYLVYFILVLAAGYGAYSSGKFAGNFDAAQILNYVGAVVTVFSLTIACYFGILAITAYSHIRDIEKAAADTKRMTKHIEETVGGTETRCAAFNSYLSDSSTVISEYLSAVGSQGANDYINRLIVIRKRFTFFDAKDDEIRLRIARDLVQLGDPADSSMLRAFLEKRKDRDARELLAELESKAKASANS